MPDKSDIYFIAALIVSIWYGERHRVTTVIQSWKAKRQKRRGRHRK